MLAIDDSKSMSKNHAGQMACEAMALIVKAMSQLEIGQLAITSFGEYSIVYPCITWPHQRMIADSIIIGEVVKLMHPFQVPFSPESGGNVSITCYTHRI